MAKRRRKKKLRLDAKFPFIHFRGTKGRRQVGRKLAQCRARLKRVDQHLLRAMAQADNRGYTGMVRGRGALGDDPRVKTLMRKRDALLKKC